MLSNQKEKFKLPETVTYLNGAYMSPLLKSVEKIGHQAVSQKCLPFEITADDFFIGSENLKKAFSEAKKNNVLLYDIMTERSEITTLLQRELSMITLFSK